MPIAADMRSRNSVHLGQVNDLVRDVAPVSCTVPFFNLVLLRRQVEYLAPGPADALNRFDDSLCPLLITVRKRLVENKGELGTLLLMLHECNTY